MRQGRKNLVYSSSRKKRSSTTKGASNLKREIGGFLTFCMGILLFLALVSYNPADPVGFSAADQNYPVHNFLGILGSTIAAPVFEWTFGYASLVFAAIIMWLGFSLWVSWNRRRVVRYTLLLFFWGYLVGIALAFPGVWEKGTAIADYFPGGFVSGFSAVILVKYLGKFAAGFIWLVLFISLSAATFRFPLSAIPKGMVAAGAGLGVLASAAFHEMGSIFRRVGELRTVFRRRKRSRIRSLPEPSTTQAKPAPIEESAREPASSSPEPVKSPPEIITQAEAGREITETPIKPRTVRVDEFGSVVDGEPEEQELKKDLEITEAIKEKELDYDSLVRNSMQKYQFPSMELLEEGQAEQRVPREELMANASLLERTLSQFGVKATVKRVIEGPVITLYAVKPAEGVKISQIVRLTDDLALAMRAKGIRMIAPIPGEAAIGIEIPNRRPSTVYFKSIVRSEKFINASGQLILGMGKTISGEVFCADLAKMPHLLIAGATGSGKSVGINTMIASLLYRVPPSDLKFVLIDPKKLELSLYAKLKDHYLAICPELDEIVITHPQNAILILRSVVNEMEERYDKLARLGVRDIVSFNKKVEEIQKAGEKSTEYRKLPYLVVIIDELADLILTAAREVEEPITRLAQMARAVGIHLIVATQRPSVDILTGLIKANFPARISYNVATRHDSRVILDMYGAEQLIGNGDMLFLPPGVGKPIRLQNPLITTDEVERIIRHIRRQPKFPPYKLKLVRERTKDGPGSVKAFERDQLFEDAKAIVIRYQQGSISLLQRKLGIGYARAARLIDQLEEAGIVGPGQGSKARDVLVSSFDEENNK
ncbi:MAG: DNA translocase FtsK [Calditrichaeota bacterium]|nr:DNA translocase FtsK [Calditrichota bacterium]